MDLGNLICRSCGIAFYLSDAHRNFLVEHGCDVEPFYCHTCFADRLREICEIPGERRVAICSICGAQTRLCFIPCQDRPVYCNKCYRQAKSE